MNSFKAIAVFAFVAIASGQQQFAQQQRTQLSGQQQVVQQLKPLPVVQQSRELLTSQNAHPSYQQPIINQQQTMLQQPGDIRLTQQRSTLPVVQQSNLVQQSSLPVQRVQAPLTQEQTLQSFGQTVDPLPVVQQVPARANIKTSASRSAINQGVSIF